MDFGICRVEVDAVAFTIARGEFNFVLTERGGFPRRAAEFKIGERPFAGGIHFELFDALARVADEQERVDLLPSDTVEVEAVPVRL